MNLAIDAEDRGFTLGDGVFDTALALGGVVFAKERHVSRLLRSAQAIGIDVERDRVESAMTPPTAAPTILRTTVTRGRAARGLWPATAGEPTLVVTAALWSPGLLGQPARLITAHGRRNEFSPTASLKTLGYLDHILAAREAAEAGVDDALILNTRGRVACSTIANIFVRIGDRLITPAVAEGCLPGVMRALVMQSAPQLGLSIEERPLVPEVLTGADTVFLTNSVRFVRPVTELDSVALATDTDFHKQLMSVLKQQVNADCCVELP